MPFPQIRRTGLGHITFKRQRPNLAVHGLAGGMARGNRPPVLQKVHGVLRPVLVGLPAAGLAVGFLAWFAGARSWSGPIFAAATIPVLLALVVEIIGSLRRGEVGLDIVAALSMTGALLLDEDLAAVVVALMYAGGQYLESFAERRATRNRDGSPGPHTAHRGHRSRWKPLGGPARPGRAGHRLLVRRGDVVAVDGTIVNGTGILDRSALTGESVPVRQGEGEPVMSGVTNVGDAFYLLATRRAAESTYAGIVRLVEEARSSKAPMARLADRFAIVFLIITVLPSAAPGC